MPCITVAQPEIEIGIQMYLKSLGLNLDNATVSMTFTQKRVGGQGLIAEVDFTQSNLKVPVPATEALKALEVEVLGAVEVPVEEVEEEDEEETVSVSVTPAVQPSSIFGAGN